MPPRKNAEGAGQPVIQDKGKGKAGANAAGAVVRRRRSKRGNRLDPEAGWSLIGDAAGRLGLWEGLRGYLAKRAFAMAAKRLVPRLAAHARAEQLLGDTLVVRVTSSAVASELSFVRDLLLAQVNEALMKMTSRPPAYLRRASKAAPSPSPSPSPEKQIEKQIGRAPIRRLQHRVGSVAELPDAAEWSGARRKQPRARAQPPAAPPQVDAQIAQALSQVQDDPLRRALSAMYAASLKSRDPV